jgi:diguanylate cyclase (GGDEF)-like protein
MAALLNSDSLSQTVDDLIAWLVNWNRLAFLDLASRADQAQDLTLPESFVAWRASEQEALSQDQPAIEQLAATHTQLQTLARLVLIKTHDNEPVARDDYENVAAKFQELIQGLRRLEKAFSTAALGLDLLTGLRSRAGVQEALTREYSRFIRTGKAFCIVIMDIDHFKAINDAHGHESGDHVLATVADQISRALRSYDDAYRIGGEEFLLCLKDTDLKTSLIALERLRQQLEKTSVTLANGQAIKVTASFGFIMSAKDIKPEDMPGLADKALYQAKNEGRNRIVMAQINAAE